MGRIGTRVHSDGRGTLGESVRGSGTRSTIEPSKRSVAEFDGRSSTGPNSPPGSRSCRPSDGSLSCARDGQLARLLGDPLPEEPPAALEKLAFADQRQAEEGLVPLMSGGKVLYKNVEELLEEDMPARGAAERLRTTWLKDRHEVVGRLRRLRWVRKGLS